MGSQDYAYAYHDAPPSDFPKNGWKRLEIHEMTEVRAIDRQLEEEMRALGYPRKDSFAVALSLREAAANAIRHGNRGDKSRTVMVSYHLSPDEVQVEVSDEGFGFNPYLVPNPFGHQERGELATRRGLFLMRVYMSWIRFNKRGNRVLLGKRRSAP
jgi:serine/threonine-protein kinase RsbW